MSNSAEKNIELPLAATHLVRDNCLCLHVHRAARALARRFDDVLRPLDLTNGQFSLLMSLNRPEPPTLRFRSGALGVIEATTATRPKDLEGAITILGERGSAENGGFPVVGRRAWRFCPEAVGGGAVWAGAARDS